MGIVISYGLESPGFEPQGEGDFPDSTSPAPRASQSPVQWAPSLFRGGKATGASRRGGVWYIYTSTAPLCLPGMLWDSLYEMYSDWLRAGRSGDRILVGGARFFTPVQTGPGAHPASCTMGTASFPGVKSGRGVTLTPHHLLVPWS